MASNFSLLNSESQVFAASDSAYLPSEPPDIKNWFPSYEYETPDLNSVASLDVCASLNEHDCDESKYNVEEESEREESNIPKLQTIRKEADLVVDESKSVSSNGHLKCKSSGTGITNSESQKVFDSSFSLISSEYNIKNWFPSYTYESPILSTSEEQFGVSDFTQSESDTYDNQHIYKDEPYVPNNSPLETVSKDTEGVRILTKNDVISIKNDESTIEAIDIASEKLKRKSHEEISCSTSLNINSDTIRDVSADGFISMKNRNRSSDKENSVHVPANDRRIKPNAERKVLFDKTNFQHVDALGVTGKWHCPQKSKPNLGPPLKQLRLEQWLHRKAFTQ